jgi:hypothetical protein
VLALAQLKPQAIYIKYAFTTRIPTILPIHGKEQTE